jgi:uncharacterized SAM-dependent methyltransferase
VIYHGPSLVISRSNNYTGNFNRSEAPEFLKDFSDVMGPNDTMLVGLDACNDPAKV